MHTMTVEQMEQLMRQLEMVFDVVRLVEPVNSQVCIIENGRISGAQPYTCHKIWEKTGLCQNCVSRRALFEQKRFSKYEFIGEDVYQVMVQPFLIAAGNSPARLLVLEMVNLATDQTLFEACGKQELIEKISATNARVYTDPLTGTYNRRFFAEGAFMRDRRFSLQGDVAFVMLDLQGFKRINDQAGHGQGDRVLRQVGRVLTQVVGEDAYAIRMGGDEFLIVSPGMAAEEVPVYIQMLAQALRNIPAQEGDAGVEGDFGFAHTAAFRYEKAFVERLLEEADRDMYANKRRSRPGTNMGPG